jgi:hypothetical protein
MRLLAEARRRGRGSKTRSRTEVIVWRMDLDGAVLLFTGASITPPAALRDLPPPDSWALDLGGPCSLRRRQTGKPLPGLCRTCLTFSWPLALSTSAAAIWTAALSGLRAPAAHGSSIRLVRLPRRLPRVTSAGDVPTTSMARSAPKAELRGIEIGRRGVRDRPVSSAAIVHHLPYFW